MVRKSGFDGVGGGWDGVCFVGLGVSFGTVRECWVLDVWGGEGLGRVEWFVFTTLSLPFAQGELRFMSEVISWIEDLRGGWDYCAHGNAVW